MMDWWPKRIPLRLRIFFRGAFALLTLATVGLALNELREEKQLSYRGYGEVFRKSVDQIAARLQHPTGQLALLNPEDSSAPRAALHPLLLPFSAIDFDDKFKALQAVEMAGCLVQYPDHARLCVAVGNNPFVGGFIYTVGEVATGPLVGHVRGDLDLGRAHRMHVEVRMRGVTYRWIAPLETEKSTHGNGLRGRLTGFVEDEQGAVAPRPNKEFRGWLWQENRCLEAPVSLDAAAPCRRRSFFSVRLPVELIDDDLFQAPRLAWPPPDLAEIRVHVQLLSPGTAEPLFDSDAAGATAPFALRDLRDLLAIGENLTVRRVQDNSQVIELKGDEDVAKTHTTLLRRVIDWFPVEGFTDPLQATRVISTPAGDYLLKVTGDATSVDRRIAAVATRMSWFVSAMLLAILITWLAIEVRIIRRITLLTSRAASVRRSAQSAQGILPLDVQDLRGRDELGLLAGVLADLLQRVNEDVKREQIRAEQEKDMLIAVGHEILAPLQSLTALHAEASDPSLRYIRRMQQAIRLLYGSAKPSEAIMSASLPVDALDINDFLRSVAINAAHAGIANVHFEPATDPVMVKAEAYSLEDVITHVLSNADRHRLAASPIEIAIRPLAGSVDVHIRNQGPLIDTTLLSRIFEYGVSGVAEEGARGHRGQGLFVAKTYMAKMGGRIEARNLGDGVELVLTLVGA